MQPRNFLKNILGAAAITSIAPVNNNGLPEKPLNKYPPLKFNNPLLTMGFVEKMEFDGNLLCFFSTKSK